MPIHEHACVNKNCRFSGRRVEHYFRKEDDIDHVQCSNCGHEMQLLISRCSVVWAKPLADYNDKNLEGANEPGHWVVRKRSSRRRDGKPESEYITSRQQQLKYCKEEGLVDPMDSASVLPSKEGKMENTTGNPGSWT